ncbi:hypothetical protein H8N01_00355 [Streptomyces sp. AC536]|uniref:hypothetical protein n=1 Tax=Streptomyces buecherae TaxID=2763006 RepID=UPI00164D3A2C|nr:hypothetical protein [Streptomyces buecherae]MBC3981067.1 hypothetical protein [Streptomyces buecherae]QNJ41613.1 hypothetical protein H7H31_18825 [Streptomyces buecherae]
MSIATVPAPASVLAPAPRWARRCAHAIALCAVPSGLWRVAMAFGVYVGYSDRVLREEFAIPGWGIAYVLGLSLLTEVAALLPLLLVSERRRVRHSRALAALAWSASAALVLGAIWQLVVACTVQSQTLMTSETAEAVWAVAFAPLFAIPVLMTAVTWSYAQRLRAAEPRDRVA